MNFSDPSKVADVIQRMQDSDESRAINRTRINSHFNGNPPWTDEEAAENRVQYNVPWGEGPTIMDNARGQWETAFTSKDKYFSVRVTKGPPHKRLEWSMEITSILAKITKGNPEYTDCINTIGAQVMLHGVGPVGWENPDKWAPYPVAIEDLKLNSRTLTSFTNLGYFAIMRRYTPFELYRAALGEYADPKWNKAMVGRILEALADVNSEETNFAQYQFPERLEEDFKSNGGYWGSDAIPTINAWDFYHRDEKEPNKFYRKILLDWDQPTTGESDKSTSHSKKDFLYDSKEPYADSHNQIIHVTFANGAHVAPFRYHSVRGLGYRLYRASVTLDKMRNKGVEAWFMELLQLFKTVPAEDRERLEFVLLNNMGVMPQGASYLPQNERYRPDLAVIMSGINQMRQLMSETSASYVQDTDSGEVSDRETATKTQARLQQANKLVGTFLTKSYVQMQVQFQEICRRFCRKDSEDKEVREFHKVCKEKEIPDEVLDIECWDVNPERVIASGDKMLGAVMVDRLMAQYPRYGPDAQRLLMRIFSESSSDPDLAAMLVPLEEEQEASSTVGNAYKDFGSMISTQTPPPMSKTGNQIDYVETLLQGMSALVQRIEKQGGMTDEKMVLGLFTVGQEIEKRIKIIEEDKAEKARTKVYGDALKRLMNSVKAFAQRLHEQAQKKGQQLSPEIMAKIQGTMLLAQTNAKIKERTADQKFRHKEVQFAKEQKRKDMETSFDISRQAREAQVDVMAHDLKTEAEIRNGARKKMAAFNEGE